MGLTTYKKKRQFTKTPEPKGGRPTGKELHFVIQKHDASHLHYDFRLEMEGVLKSWAVPKGPSTDPSVKRLAMMVEDHPFDYKDFEGIIPKGQYGGGTVIVWDEGTYELAEGEFSNRKEMEKQLLRQLNKGKLVINLHGHKLKGEFHMVRSSYQGNRSWLLMKGKDKYAKPTDILKKDKSVISGKTIKQMEGTPAGVWNSNKEEKKTKIAARRKGKALQKKNPPGKKSPRPQNLKPMLATLVDGPPKEVGWIYEIKWDGYRALAYCNKEKVELRSRNDLDFKGKFYPVADALKKLSINAVLDGEIVVLKEEGHSDFGSLQNWRSEDDGQLYYYVFDVLWADGHSLLDLPLMERKTFLESIITGKETIRLSEVFETDGEEFLEAARKLKLEGIIGKKKESLYSPGYRTKEWIKVKIGNRQEVVIGGFTKNEGTPRDFSALLVGLYKNGKLRYAGKVGTGWSAKTQKEMMKKFRPLISKNNPFETLPDVNKRTRFRPNPPNAKAIWLKPKLVCEVSYTEMTRDGIMRHPSFEGMRIDKKAKEVVEE